MTTYGFHMTYMYMYNNIHVHVHVHVVVIYMYSTVANGLVQQIHLSMYCNVHIT